MMVGSKFDKWQGAQLLEWSQIVHPLAPCNSNTLEALIVAIPLWAKCEDETHTPKSGNLESSRTLKNSEPDCRGQNSLHWCVVYTIGKVLKCRCPKWLHMRHLDLCSPSYGQKKSRKPNWQFDSRPLKVDNRPKSDVSRWSATWHW
jgi:hypothetical protein